MPLASFVGSIKKEKYRVVIAYKGGEAPVDCIRCRAAQTRNCSAGAGRSPIAVLNLPLRDGNTNCGAEEES